jgi:hypothetical protein
MTNAMVPKNMLPSFIEYPYDPPYWKFRRKGVTSTVQ